MKKSKKHVIMGLATAFCMMAGAIPVFAASGSYSTTYDMTGGVFSKRTWDATATPTFVVDNSNCYSVYDSYIDVMLQKKNLAAYSTKSSKQLSSRNSSSCTLKGSGSGTYRLYFHQDTGFQMTGDLVISWRW